MLLYGPNLSCMLWAYALGAMSGPTAEMPDLLSNSYDLMAM